MSASGPIVAPIPDGAVVVGVDGSATADRAVEWAARYAARAEQPLVIAHAFGLVGAPEMVGLHFDSGAVYALVYEQLHAGGEAVVADASATVAKSFPSLGVTTVIDEGDARGLLLRLAEHASLVVMGSRGRGPFRSMLLGSVTATVAGRAGCPVVVVPPSGDRDDDATPS